MLKVIAWVCGVPNTGRYPEPYFDSANAKRSQKKDLLYDWRIEYYEVQDEFFDNKLFFESLIRLEV
jgi:hypothetical protein